MIKSSFITLCLLILSSEMFGQLTALEIIEKSDEKMRGTSNRSEMSMTIVRPEWSREIKMKGWSLGQEFSLILITSPARDKGTATLKRTKEIWNWQPSIDRVVKLPPSMMMQSWMGSDFTNDDLVRESSIVNDYTHELVGDTTIDNREAHKILLIPKEDAPVVWGKIHAYITKVDYIQMLVKYFDEDGFLINISQVNRNILSVCSTVIINRNTHNYRLTLLIANGLIICYGDHSNTINDKTAVIVTRDYLPIS